MTLMLIWSNSSITLAECYWTLIDDGSPVQYTRPLGSVRVSVWVGCVGNGRRLQNFGLCIVAIYYSCALVVKLWPQHLVPARLHVIRHVYGCSALSPINKRPLLLSWNFLVVALAVLSLPILPSSCHWKRTRSRHVAGKMAATQTSQIRREIIVVTGPTCNRDDHIGFSEHVVYTYAV